MSKVFNQGDKIEYLLEDRRTGKGSKKWLKGTIHAVRKVDDVNGTARVLTYVIDTGRNVRVDVHRQSLREEAYRGEIKKHRKTGKAQEQSHALALETIEKMPDEYVETTERQPEQVDVRPDFVRAR